MTKEQMPMGRLVEALVDAAIKEQWEIIDDELVPQIRQADGNQMAVSLLSKITDENPNVRDVVATSLKYCQITDERILKTAVESMIEIATTDNEKFPTGRAMDFLLSHRGEEKFKEEIDSALTASSQRVKDRGWVDALKENIPTLVDFLK